jgi:hypothetical protein
MIRTPGGRKRLAEMLSGSKSTTRLLHGMIQLLDSYAC